MNGRIFEIHHRLIETVGKVHISRHSNLFNKYNTTLHSVLLANIDLNVSILPLFRKSLIIHFTILAIPFLYFPYKLCRH